MKVDFGAGHFVAGVVGLVVAWMVLRPPLRRSALAGRWPQVVAAGVAITVLFPVLVVLVDHTRFFVERGMAEVGSPAFEEPPVSEEAAVQTREVFQPGDTWALTIDGGRCADIGGNYWLAFRYVPHEQDCVEPDVELFWKERPPPGAPVARSGDDYAVVRW